ncbi:MAG TPA: GNAT family N-acetyltransferase [Flavilitoribacter sp.]|nr:GNAT family N-acetyltransferase [Flavilitoribacter sp.]HMQ87561.1 GNAT family N-acetyltransferase [Flavilitoribacter sp.]
MQQTFHISTDKSRLDIPMIHRFLSEEAYWCKGIPLETVRRSIENSLCFGVFDGENQVGFARVITDYATIAYLGDVFILPDYRSQGLSKMLMTEVMGHPDLLGLRRWILLTGDAHGLYRQFGWTDIASPDRWMELHDARVYTVDGGR